MQTSTAQALTGRKILLGVTGGIGAYKAAELVRAFKREGAQVSVVMTRSATHFITPLTLETLSQNPVGLDMFSLTEERTIGHIDRAAWADVFVVAPATANYLGKAANGIADDLLTTITLAIRCPVVLAPAMNSRMWSHPAVVANLAELKSRGAVVVPPGEGELACGEVGPGRLAETEIILAGVRNALAHGDLTGIRVLVTAGPTREPIDPVRFISNRSTGRMGYAIAEAAVSRGAEVTLVTGPVSLPEPPVRIVQRVSTAHEMLEGVKKALPDCDWLIMAAAVGDFRPSRPSGQKIKKDSRDGISLNLERNPDILKEIGPLKGGRLFAGFAAETEDLIRNAEKKIREKGLDLIVANDVSAAGSGFESDENQATLIDRDGGTADLERMPKRVMADRILDKVLSLWKGR
ncbi:MAG: bifunctional phosphopantothenoylcysteine decarboxylase/phosphopantothenate--cysteine ligase CoaBC [bacterium]|nr:MAG: bifunctional phosphopantothenoylcysteine decarboxylase/phosphopantothenate--cysteine ligase CoaBC [bacterium]